MSLYMLVLRHNKTNIIVHSIIASLLRLQSSTVTLQEPSPKHTDVRNIPPAGKT